MEPTASSVRDRAERAPKAVSRGVRAAGEPGEVYVPSASERMGSATQVMLLGKRCFVTH